MMIKTVYLFIIIKQQISVILYSFKLSYFFYCCLFLYVYGHLVKLWLLDGIVIRSDSLSAIGIDFEQAFAQLAKQNTLLVFVVDLFQCWSQYGYWLLYTRRIYSSFDISTKLFLCKFYLGCFIFKTYYIFNFYNLIL